MAAIAPFETLPARLQRLRPLTIKRLVERHALLMISGGLRTGIYPSCQFLPSGRVVKGCLRFAQRSAAAISFP